MKNAYVFFLLTVSVTFSRIEKSHAQWIQQSPFPTGLHLNSPYFITPSHGFAVGINHLLLETTDGGATWIVRMSDSYGTHPFYTIAFANSSTGFITGNSTTEQRDILRTQDGGETWTEMTDFPLGGSWNLIDFISPEKVFFGSNGACVFTSNGGDGFVIKSGYPNCPVMYGMDFRDEQVGLVAGNLQGSDGIFKTTNGGNTWKKKFSLPANDVLWWTNSTAFAAGGTSVYRSSNQGDTWTEFATGITTGLLQLERIDDVTLSGVSAKGDVWRSDDEGQTWSHVLDGPGDLPTRWSLQFTDEQHGWLVGQSGFIYNSNDGGITWEQVSNGAGVQLTDLEFQSDDFGMGVGENGYLFRTTNGGSLWSVQKLEVTGQIFGRDESLHGISIVDENFAVAAGPGGTVFRTYDGGMTWESIGYPDLPGSFWIEDVKFIDENTGWLVGQDQDLGHQKTVYKTINGGNTWTLAMNENAYMYSVDFVDAQHGWITTSGNLFFRTSDGGTTWHSGNYPPYFTSPTVTDIRFADQNVGWAVGWDGFVAHTTNGGIIWTLQDIGTTEDHLFAIDVVSSTEAWATGREGGLSPQGVVYHTTDGGANWTREVSASNPYWGVAIAESGGNVWIGGFEGRIFKKENSICVAPTVSISTDGPTTFCKGGSVTLTAITTGTPGTYQWKIDGNNINGETNNTYSATKAASFTTVVTNGCGSATSNAIPVTVNKNPQPTISPSGTVTMCAGDQTLLVANTGNGLSYQWMKNGTDINGATNSTYAATAGGKYSVRETKNATGCSAVSAITKIQINCKTIQSAEPAAVYGELYLYPNPTAGNFAIDLNMIDAMTSQVDIQLMNELGELVYSRRTEIKDSVMHCEINSNLELAAGNYFVRVIAGNKCYSTHLVVQ